MHDLVIKGGTVVDGTGAPRRTADVAITDGTVTEVGKVDGPAARTIDADGGIVTPGFVDVHTHYDGQATWDTDLSPSCWHGVTTAVMGNCGVGFAPVAPDRHEWLIGLMEGVEDIPGAALSVGIDWQWETFPEYLDLLATRQWVMDVGTQVPHGAVRAYVMGERGARNEPADADDIVAMSKLVEDGLRAGALGFTTSRTLAHRAIDGEPVPGTFAATDELYGLGDALARAGHGVFELAPAGALGEDVAGHHREMDWMRDLADRIRRPVLFGLTQNDADPDGWSKMLALVTEAQAEGIPIHPQVHGRAVAILQGLQTFHPFMFAPSWGALGMEPIERQVALLGDPDRRRLLVEEMEQSTDPIVVGFMKPTHTFLMGDPPNYQPGPEDSVAGLASQQGRSPWDVLYDLLLRSGGRELLLTPILNYSDLTLEAAGALLDHPASIFGLGDGGAHASQTCDASITTFMLTYWARDRGDERFPLERAVKKITSETAQIYGLGDRGVLAPGLVGDVNVIDWDRLTIRRPELAFDLPGGAKRLIQRAGGYRSTIKGGEVTFEDGEATGATPGRLLRST